MPPALTLLGSVHQLTQLRLDIKLLGPTDGYGFVLLGSQPVTHSSQ
jgi:hypothetical protein